jgi:hypothetical protein
MYKYFKRSYYNNEVVYTFNTISGQVNWFEDGIRHHTTYPTSYYKDLTGCGVWTPCDKDGNLLNKDTTEEGENMLENVKVGDKLLCLKSWEGFFKGLYVYFKQGSVYPVVEHYNGYLFLSNYEWYTPLSHTMLEGHFKKLTPKQKLPHKQGKRGEKENWVKTITLAKYNRCIEKCEEVAKGVYLDRETSCAYLMYSAGHSYCRASDNGIPTRIKLSGENGVEWYLNLVKAYDNFSKDTHKHKSVIGDGLLKDPFVEDKPTQGEWTDKHYNFNYKLTEDEIKSGIVKLDVYKVSKVWRIGSKDDSGALWHSLKTIARFGDKNPVEREIRALYEQVKGLARENGVELK